MLSRQIFLLCFMTSCMISILLLQPSKTRHRANRRRMATTGFSSTTRTNASRAWRSEPRCHLTLRPARVKGIAAKCHIWTATAVAFGLQRMAAANVDNARTWLLDLICKPLSSPTLAHRRYIFYTDRWISPTYIRVDYAVERTMLFNISSSLLLSVT